MSEVVVVGSFKAEPGKEAEGVARRACGLRDLDVDPA